MNSNINNNNDNDMNSNNRNNIDRTGGLQLQPLVVPAVGPDHGLHDAGLPREALRHAVHHAVRALAQELLRGFGAE